MEKNKETRTKNTIKYVIQDKPFKIWLDNLFLENTDRQVLRSEKNRKFKMISKSKILVFKGGILLKIKIKPAEEGMLAHRLSYTKLTQSES